MPHVEFKWVFAIPSDHPSYIGTRGCAEEWTTNAERKNKGFAGCGGGGIEEARGAGGWKPGDDWKKRWENAWTQKSGVTRYNFETGMWSNEQGEKFKNWGYQLLILLILLIG